MVATVSTWKRRTPMPNDNATTTHEKLYEDALNAINLLFSDNTVAEVTTRKSLAELKGEINVMLDALGEDMEDEAVLTDEELSEEEDEEDDDSTDIL
jgi:hypothetical protein